MKINGCLLILLACLATTRVNAAAPDLLFADFESPTYGDWAVTGNAFGEGPASGTLPNQMEVSGYKGKRLVNSYHGGDDTTGTLTSPSFKIERRYIAFLVGGGGFKGKTCINLLVDDKIVRTTTGQNTQPGGRELLEDAQWDVTDWAGKTGRIQIVDDAKGGWGHILVDHIVFTDNAALTLATRAQREVVAQQKLLFFPVKNGAPIRKVTIRVEGQVVREFTIEATDDAPNWSAPLDISAWRGKTLKVEVDKLPESSKFLTALGQADGPRDLASLYHEPLRPQFHFSPAHGWNNDPNGMIYFNGEYHLFFQLNPYGTQWGNMHWGHAVSKDMFHWRELDIALYPDAFGTMFSGSAVVDWKNTSGLGIDGKPPLVLAYTADGKSVQCIASSMDGRSFTKYPGNPVVPMIAGGNRDPKVFWHEPTRQWVMALYVGFEEPPKEGKGKSSRRDTIHFLTSPNLKDWKKASQIDGFYECPDLFPLAVDGDPKNTKWVLTAASSEYRVGQFDGTTFTPETGKLKGHLGRGFYAAQTFNNIPDADGRRIMIGWFQTPSPGMAFNQSMSVPLEIKLLNTPDGPRLSYLPVRELESLRTQTRRTEPTELKAGDKPLVDPGAELLDIRLEFEPGEAGEIELNVHGAAIRYDARHQLLKVNDVTAPAPLRGGKQKLIVLVDRNSLEVFASDGLAYVPMPFIPKEGVQTIQLSTKEAAVRIHSLEIHTLKSSWESGR